MKRKFIGIIGIVVFISIPVLVKLTSGGMKKNVDIDVVLLKKIEPTVLASGNLAFRQEVQLSSELIGKVSDVLVKEGQIVEKNQILLKLDPSSYLSEVAQQTANRRSAQIAIERAELSLSNQQRALERSKVLVGAAFIGASKHEEAVFQREISAVELRASKEALRQADALLLQARERLAKTVVHAPISGTVTIVQIKAGETAVASALGMAGSSLLTIADVGTIIADMNVDEADIAVVAIGQVARVYPSAYSDKPMVGKVESVSMMPKLGPQGRSYVVKLRLQPATLALRTGMTCRAEIIVGSGIPRPVVPLQAVLTDQVSTVRQKPVSFVFQEIDGVVYKREVELGEADDKNQEILRGLLVGNRIVTGPARTLHELRERDQVVAAIAHAANMKLAAQKEGKQ